MHHSAEDVQQEALTLALDIACMVQKNQRFSLHRYIGNQILVHSRILLNHPAVYTPDQLLIGCMLSLEVTHYWLRSLFTLRYGSYVRSMSRP